MEKGVGRVGVRNTHRRSQVVHICTYIHTQRAFPRTPAGTHRERMEEGNQFPTRLCTVGVATASAAPIAKRHASWGGVYM